MGKNSGKKATKLFVITFVFAVVILVVSIVKTNLYNLERHHDEYSEEELFLDTKSQSKDVCITAEVRGSTWTKAFDLKNQGIIDHNYQAYTVDYTISNYTMDQVKDFVFTIKFHQNTFLLSGWNGSLEIHQMDGDREIVETIPDLREFDSEKYELNTFTADGETMVTMKEGDYLIYHPSSSMNAMEIPIEPQEATTPGLIMYVPIGNDIEDMTVELEYSFNRLLIREPLFWVSIGFMLIWGMILITFVITSIQIRKYKKRHERDNEIIKESMEIFIGFIDAKDPYTNGHSKRVAVYTRRIAKEFGYEEEELENIYYIALLHDCGKIGVPDRILRKPEKLTDEEYEIIKSHTLQGGKILDRFKSLDHAGEGARYHHERYDGKGYPEGKAGKDIPFIARMICVADSYDAMNTNRVYRDKLSQEHIISELEKCKGRQFDPEITDVMLRLIKEGQIEYETFAAQSEESM